MELAITPILELFGDRMKHLEKNAGIGGGGLEIGMSELAVFEDKW